MEEIKEKVALIDADSIIYISGWDIVNKCYYTDFELIKSSADNLINNILSTTKSKYYLGFLSPSNSFRNELFSDYKENRKNLKKPDHFDQLKNYLIDNWKFLKLQHYEADDVVSIFKKEFNDSIICSIDKDVLNLEGTHFNYKKNEFVTVSYLDSIVYFWKSMIIGDTVDNIKGLNGKGKVFADNLLLNINDESIMRNLVFNEYINQYGEYKGIELFYKNYKLLKIVDKDDEFVKIFKYILEKPLEVNKRDNFFI